MRSGVPCIPLPKAILRALLSNERPPFRKEAAYISLQLDYDQQAECSLAGYAKLWGWSRGKVRRFLEAVGASIVYSDDPKSHNQTGHLAVHGAASPPKKNGHEADTPPRKNGHEADTTIDPKILKNKDMLNFDVFWKAYPRKQGKQAALKAWRKLEPGPDLQASILDALEAHKASSQWQKDDGQYIPYPATWLNGGRWEDEIDASAHQQPQLASDPKHQQEAAEVARRYGLS